MKKIIALAVLLSCTSQLSIAADKNIIIFSDSLSDVGYENNLSNVYNEVFGIPWPLIQITKDGSYKHTNIEKQPTFTSPQDGNTIWPQFLMDGNATTNTYNTPKTNIGISVKNIPVTGNVYAAGGATITGVGIGISDPNCKPGTP